MRLIYQILLPILCLFLERVDLTYLSPIKMTIMNYQLLDGDTLVIESPQKLRVRFLYVDTPEMGQTSFFGSLDLGLWVKNQLAQKLKNCINLSVDLFKKDLYSRWLGEIYCDGESLSKYLVAHGLAFIYPYGEFQSHYQKNKFLRLFKTAVQKKKGIWKFGKIENPFHYRKRMRLINKSQSRRSPH